MTHETTIHLEWDGPYSLDQARHMRSNEDWGVYQIYGCHPVYGADALLYIGKAERRTFGERLSQEKWWDFLSDTNETKIYLGRLAGETDPDDTEWCRLVSLAERILIFAHRPAWNAQMNLGRLDSELQSVHVFNWNNHRSLLPETSGFRWTSRSHTMSNYHVFVSGSPSSSEEIE